MFTCPKGHQSTDSDYCSECGTRLGASTLGSNAKTTGILSGSGSSNAATNSNDICPDCATPRVMSARFCEVCRYDFQSKSSHAPSSAPAMPARVAAPLSAPVSAPILAPVSVPTALQAQVSTIAPIAVASSAPSVQSQTSPADSVNATPSGTNAWAMPNKFNVEIMVDASMVTDQEDLAKCPVGTPLRVFPLDLDENLVGRRSDKKGIYPEISIEDPGASHRHIKLLRQADGSYAALDLGSLNGSSLNGTELAAGVLTVLKPGDELTLGIWTRIRIVAR